jgi:hypothetical protein
MKLEKFDNESVKQYRKDLDEVIRIKKMQRKDEANRRMAHFSAFHISMANAITGWCQKWVLDGLREEARALHIAVCELRGRERSAIEPKTDSKPNERMVSEFKANILAYRASIAKPVEGVNSGTPN